MDCGAALPSRYKAMVGGVASRHVPPSAAGQRTSGSCGLFSTLLGWLPNAELLYVLLLPGLEPTELIGGLELPRAAPSPSS